MTHSSRRASVLIASAVLVFASSTAFAAAESALPTDVTALPNYIARLVADAPGNHPHHRHYAYRHHHHVRESLDTRRARYALARACSTSFVSADICKFTSGLITMAK